MESSAPLTLNLLRSRQQNGELEHLFVSTARRLETRIPAVNIPTPTYLSELLETVGLTLKLAFQLDGCSLLFAHHEIRLLGRETCSGQRAENALIHGVNLIPKHAREKSDIYSRSRGLAG